MLTGFVISTTVSLILVSYRLKNNYYEKNKKRAIEYMTIVGLGDGDIYNQLNYIKDWRTLIFCIKINSDAPNEKSTDVSNVEPIQQESGNKKSCQRANLTILWGKEKYPDGYQN